MFKLVNGIKVNLTESEIAEFNAEKTAWENGSKDRKLVEIKNIRLQKLKETDYLANTDVTMSDEIKTWRQSLRNIPQDYTTENEYDLLLARHEKTGNLTHTV